MRDLTEKQIREMLNVDDGAEMNDQVKKAQFSVLQRQAAPDVAEDIHYLGGVQLELEAELGSTYLNLKDVISLSEGQVITLDRIAGDNVDLIANKRWLAYGEVLMLNETLGIRISSFNQEEENQSKGGK